MTFLSAICPYSWILYYGTNKHNSDFQQLSRTSRIETFTLYSILQNLMVMISAKQCVNRSVLKARAEGLPCDIWKVKDFQVEKGTFLTLLLYRYAIKKYCLAIYKTGRGCTLGTTEPNKSHKCPERDSNQGPPDCDDWVTLPPTVTELFTVKLISEQTDRLHCSRPNCRTSATRLRCSYNVKIKV